MWFTFKTKVGIVSASPHESRNDNQWQSRCVIHSTIRQEALHWYRIQFLSNIYENTGQWFKIINFSLQATDVIDQSQCYFHWLKPEFFISFSFTSPLDRQYHSFLFVSFKIVSINCQIIFNMLQQFLTYKVTKTSSCVTISLQLPSQDSSLCKSLVVYYKFRDTFIIGIYIYIICYLILVYYFLNLQTVFFFTRQVDRALGKLKYTIRWNLNRTFILTVKSGKVFLEVRWHLRYGA